MSGSGFRTRPVPAGPRFGPVGIIAPCGPAHSTLPVRTVRQGSGDPGRPEPDGGPGASMGHGRQALEPADVEDLAEMVRVVDQVVPEPIEGL